MDTKGKIGIVIESTFNETEFIKYKTYFPEKGYKIEFLSYLWGQSGATYTAALGENSPEHTPAQVYVEKDVTTITDFSDYKGIVLMGGACADRLRYEAEVKEGAFNHAPTVDFVRRAARAANENKIKFGVICHGMWLVVAAPELLYNRRITTAHNIISDVKAAGGRLVYDIDTRELVRHVVDGNFITARQGSPDVVKNFVEVFVEELDKGFDNMSPRYRKMYVSDAERFIQRFFALLSGKNSIEDLLTFFPSAEDDLPLSVEIANGDPMTTPENLRDWYTRLEKTTYDIKQLSVSESSDPSSSDILCTAHLEVSKRNVESKEEIRTRIFLEVQDVKGNKLVITKLLEGFKKSITNGMQSTLLMGIVQKVEDRKFYIQCRSGDYFSVKTTESTVWNALTNLGEQGMNRDRYGDLPSTSASPIRKYLKKGVLVSIRGTFYADTQRKSSFMDARVIHLLYKLDGQILQNTPVPELQFSWESPRWWQQQVRAMADKWLGSLWPGKDEYDFHGYLSNLDITLRSTNDNSQECATLSRLIYGLSSSYLLTGTDRYFDAAKAGVEFQRKHYKIQGDAGNFLLWAFGRVDKKLFFTSRSGDDENTIPLYEQIYDLAGMSQFYRITQDWTVIEDIKLTMASFNKFYKDNKLGGYFSHLDYVSSSCEVKTLGINQAKKNWNSIGDHIPAYLINLILALEKAENDQCSLGLKEILNTAKSMLDETTQLIIDHFFKDMIEVNELKEKNLIKEKEKAIPYVLERFEHDWVPDIKYSWQQNRAIIGHNLKIAWNFIRVASYYQKTNPEKASHLAELAVLLGNKMLEVGAIDLFGGGCYDAVEREPFTGQPPKFAWANTKDFWQQEQGILAYYVLYGYTGKKHFLDAAREMSAFWNIYFLDRDNTGIHFRTTDIGDPVIEGSYGAKAGHAIAGYHMFELNYLAHIYISVYVTKKDFSLFFRPSNKDTKRFVVWPDFLIPGSVRVKSVTINGAELREGEEFSAEDGWVKLRDDATGSTVRVTFEPIKK